MKVGVALVKDVDVKFASTLCLLRISHISTKCTYENRTENLSFRSHNVSYLISCKNCHKFKWSSGEGLIIIVLRIATIQKRFDTFQPSSLD